MNDADLSFGARAIYGANTRRGLVEMTLGGATVTVLPAKAREMATFMIEAATAAEGDEVLMRVLDRAGMSPRASNGASSSAALGMRPAAPSPRIRRTTTR